MAPTEQKHEQKKPIVTRLIAGKTVESKKIASATFLRQQSIWNTRHGLTIKYDYDPKIL